MRETAGVRRFGSAALDLAWVAAGRFDVYWEHALQAWDIAAGILMVREAGGLVSDLAGGSAMLDSGDILAANGTIQKQMTALLKTTA
jgi:myo-inositol-1(or 4)-monophosphatase